MKTLLIRAEDKNRWERRAPITPPDLERLLKKTGARAYVERSQKRFFDTAQYKAAGAITCSDMASGDVIFGIKEIPIEKIIDNQTYVFFSHTIKGQKDNMPLLRRMLNSGITLIDYEKITDDTGKRLIYFGSYAGDAGAIDILSLMGEHWAHKGLPTPLASVKRAHQYQSVADARAHLSRIGDEIRSQGLPPQLSPLTVGILGYGNVSRGAQEVFDCLPTQRVSADDIDAFVNSGRGDAHTLYLTIFKEQDLVRPKTAGAAFDLKEYYNHPQRYESRFDRFIPSFTILVNAVYWEKRYPKFVTWAGLKRLFERSPSARLSGIADITCDTHGSVECNVKSTDSDMPAYQVNPLTGEIHDGHLGEGIVLLAIDNLPCELPNDSSTFFSNQLVPFVPNLLEADYSTRLEASGLCPEFQRATIVYNGQLTEKFSYLREHL